MPGPQKQLAGYKLVHVVLERVRARLWLGDLSLVWHLPLCWAASRAVTSSLPGMVHSAAPSAGGAALPESEFPEFSSGQPAEGQNFENST